MYTIGDIAAMVQAQWLQKGKQGPVSQLLNDSRKLLFPETTVFFALVTENRNGHQYIPSLYQQGVRFFVVSEPVNLDQIPEASVLRVNDTVSALQQLAAAHRRRFDYPVIGITGSNGKTTVKEWLNQLLEPEHRIVRSPRSYNSQIGVPLSVWLLRSDHQLAIIEAGISQTGEMDKLGAIIRPDIGIFTNLGAAHSEGFSSMEEKLAEKWKLFAQSRIILTHYQEDWINQYVDTHLQPGQQVLRWGKSPDAALQILEQESSENETRMLLRYQGSEFRLIIPFSNEAAVENVLTCLLAALVVKKDSDSLQDYISRLQERIQQLQGISMRLELKDGINQCSIINDSYSADLSSLVIALDFLAQQQQHSKKTVILSDIPESGWTQEALYDRIAGLLQHHGVSRLIGVGTNISARQAVFQQNGIKEVQCFAETDLLLQHWESLNFREETILIKGARRFAFERISAQLEKQVHQTVMEVNLNAMLNNLKWYQQKLRKGTKLMAMVKAFSYGSGSFEIANLLQFHGVDYLTVAYTDEGVALRRAGIHLPIMVMNVAPTGFDALVEHHLEPVLYSASLFQSFDAYIRREGIPQYPVHLELETGMHRLGFAESELPLLLELVRHTPCKVQSVFSHFVASEDPAQDAFTRLQAERFIRMTAALQDQIPYRFLRHIENTSGINRHPDWQFDMVRLGIGLYGIDTSMESESPLEEVSTLITTIAQIKQVDEGETVGYNRRGVMKRKGTTATIRIGYADGYPRSLGNGAGHLLVKGKLVPTIGSICMDMTMIDITDVPECREGDPVIVFGKGLSVSQVAAWAGTIPYEILTGISQRVKRIYYQE